MSTCSATHAFSPAIADTEPLAPAAAADAGLAMDTPVSAPLAAPSTRRAALAVGLVPPTVLMALLAVVAGLIEPATGMALFATGLAWLVFEMHRYLRRMEAELETAAQAGPWG